ncbi:MAG: adenylate/guanylate cyclase domain-containing protein [Leptospiraceae bacterium]|nr:adenylate/guanylate cyclase domain-containing protein [Leptospiraceae bacterium]
MMYFNIGSVLWFIFTIWVNKQGFLTLAVYLAFTEVLVHAAFCTHYFGWDSGFPYFALLFSTGVFILPPEKVAVKIISIIIGALTFIGFFYYTRFHKPIYIWKSPFIEIINITNIVISSLVHASFSYYFTFSANKAEDTIEELMQREVEREAREKEYIKDIFGKAVDYRIRDYLLENKDFQLGKNLESTILFMDIRGFTRISEKKNSREVVTLLNRLFVRMDECITRNHGTINKFIGDAILAIFNVPIQIEGHVDSALKSAIEMFEELEKLNIELTQEGEERLDIGIGIHTGLVLAGNIGSQNRLEYTVIGDTVNTASRLESATKTLKTKLLISEDTYNKLLMKENLKYLAKIKVKGKLEPIKVYGINKIE